MKFMAPLPPFGPLQLVPDRVSLKRVPIALGMNRSMKSKCLWRQWKAPSRPRCQSLGVCVHRSEARNPDRRSGRTRPGFWQEGQRSTSEMLIFGGMWVELRQYMWRSFVRATSERI